MHYGGNLQIPDTRDVHRSNTFEIDHYVQGLIGVHTTGIEFLHQGTLFPTKSDGRS
jgi:hypothetical protein